MLAWHQTYIKCQCQGNKETDNGRMTYLKYHEPGWTIILEIKAFSKIYTRTKHDVIIATIIFIVKIIKTFVLI